MAVPFRAGLSCGHIRYRRLLCAGSGLDCLQTSSADGTNNSPGFAEEHFVDRATVAVKCMGVQKELL
jgi:hypothetical protein